MATKIEYCLEIKSLLERLSGVENIGVRSRKRFIIDLKKTYYTLCQEFTTASLKVMGKTLGDYDHSTALHGIRTFENLYGAPDFNCNEIYKGAKAILMDKQEAVQRLLNASKKDVPLSIPEIKIKHLIALINISEKAHSVITNKALRIRALESVLRDAQIFIEDPNPKEVETFYKIKNKIKFALLK